METMRDKSYRSLKVQQTCAALLAIMFTYAALSKLANYQLSREQMLNQIFPDTIAVQLTWSVPVLELLITISLVLRTTIRKGLYASLLLLTAFSLYISLTMSGIFGSVPCSCGGILKNLGYTTHLLFNLFFILLAVIGIKADQRWITHKWLHFKQKGDLPKID